MAEFAAGLLTSIGAAGPTAISGTSAAGTFASTGSLLFPGLSAAGAIGSASAFASILSGGATVASMLAAKRAGEEKGFALELQAEDALAGATVEEIQGAARRTSLKASLVKAIGERDVANAASGVDLSFGTPALARREAVEDSERALALDQSTENFRKAKLLERASNFRLLADEARRGGLLKAAGIGLTGAAALARRG